MDQLDDMTVRDAISVLRGRIENHRRAEENARIDRQNDEAAVAALEGLMRSGNDASRAETAAEHPALLGLAAVREVMRGSPTQVWTPRAVHTELEFRGWVSGEAKHPRAGTESAIGRLLAKGEIEKVARGRYRWREEVPTED